MQFNVTKCYTMKISRKKEKPELMDYYDRWPKAVSREEPFFMLSNYLRLNSHVENIVVKANKSLGFVRRNLYPCSQRTKCSAYVTIVRSNLKKKIKF